MMYEHPPPEIRDYAEPADPELLAQFEAEVENYSTDDYQTPQVEALCNRILADAGFPSVFSFDPKEQATLESEHVCAYKHLRLALFQFEQDGGVLEQLEKPYGAHEWIEAQIRIERERIEQEGQDILVSEVETSSDSSEEDNDSGDDGLILDLNLTT